ncbi:PX domain-containing protein 1-like isoform X2 [Hoplias malabaricus]|uniref:PX domain-containing protein 1-like isoform X2 n=1 Tax=Hoplias malabaricus TaxID=27720 RepID=UPI00346267A6
MCPNHSVSKGEGERRQMEGSSPQEEDKKEEKQRKEELRTQEKPKRRNSELEREVERLWTELSAVTSSAPGDGGTVETSVLEALQRIRESEKNADEETRLSEVEGILRDIISMSRKYSQSEAMMTFFHGTSFDSIQPFSPVTVADIWRSNGFCLANTETILYDAHLSKPSEKSLTVHTGRGSSQVLRRTHVRHEDRLNLNKGPTPLNSAENGFRDIDHTATKPQSCTNDLSYLQLEVCETDILE